MLSPRLILVTTIVALTVADTQTVTAQHRRHRSTRPRRQIQVCPECPECPRYEMKEPGEVFPDPNPDMSTRDQPAPPPLLDSEKGAQPDQTRPSDQTTPSTTPQQQQQQQPQAPQTANPTFNPSPSTQPTTAATSPLSSAPNMVGDFLGGIGIFNVTLPGLSVFDPNGTLVPGPVMPLAMLDAQGRVQIDFDPLGPATNAVATSALTQATINMGWTDTPGLDRFDLDTTRNLDGSLLVTDATNAPNGQIGNGTPGFFIRLGGTAILTTPVADNAVTLGPAGDGFAIDFDNVYYPIVNFDVPIGALAGRVKLAENTSPMPRDRLIVNYSLFDNVALAPGGVQVNRFTPGFEKTFLEGLMSFELRVPFATTLDQDIVASNTNGLGTPGIGLTNVNTVEFGNVTTTLKTLLYQDRQVAYSTGLSVAVPTADDISVASDSGVELFRVENEAVHLMPFIGALYTPNSRFFAQGIVQADFAANGNNVFANFNPNPLDPVANELFGPPGPTKVGALTDPTFLYVDVGVGYWFYRNDCCSAKISGVAGIAELHYNGSLQDFDTVVAPITVNGVPLPDLATVPMGPATVTPEFRIAGGDNFSQLNALVGGSVEFMRDTTLQFGYSTPIAGDKNFDGELRVNFNRRFGRSARRSPAMQAATF